MSAPFTHAADRYGRRARPATHRRWATPGHLARAINPRTVQTPALDVVDAAIVEAFATPDSRTIVSMPPQEGKALALDTPVATPSGWATIGALRVGDQVFGRDGHPCRVTWLSPIWTGRDCYTVQTGDGEAIVADVAHEWPVRLDRRSAERIADTAALARTRAKAAQITGTPGLVLPDADLPVDPYTLGAWLGDGSTRAAMLTCDPADVHIVDRIRAAGVPCRRMSSGPFAWSLTPADGSGSGRGRCSPIRAALQTLGVWGAKHIPDAYLRGSQQQRLALLQGLVDTDGYVSPRGQVEFTSTNPRLAEQVRDLVFTLGAKATVTVGRATIDGRDCGPKYRVRFYLAAAASLPRKAERCRNSPVAQVRYVRAAPTRSVATRCIEVDSPDHTFLAGRSLLPTHNSERVTKTGTLWGLEEHPDWRFAIACYAQPLAEDFSREVRNWITTNDGTEGMLDLGLRIARDNGAARRWKLSGSRGGVVAVGIESGLTGRPVDALVVDDPFKDREQADSQYYRDKVWAWWQSVGSTRLAPGAPVFVILTRWHEDDLAGRLLAAEDGHRWRVINIPAQADHDPAKGESDPLGRAPGEWLRSARGRTVAQWEAIRIQAGTRVFTSLYQGRPSPDVGNVWRRGWWRRYEQLPFVLAEADEVVQSWDMAFKDTKGSDFVVGQVWARRGAEVFLLDQVCRRMSFTETIAALEGMCARWPEAKTKLVEDKANGTAVIDSLHKKIPGIVAVTPRESKLARAYAGSPFIEAGNVYLPSAETARFDVQALIDEAAGFPNGAHDDQVDATSQALARFFLDGTGAAAWTEWLRSRAEQQSRGAALEPAVRGDDGDDGGALAEPAAAAVVVDLRQAARQAAFRAATGRAGVGG